LSRTETRTKCSACGIDTTVPFKPTQGRPVLCRSCFQLKRVPSAVTAVANMDSPAKQIAEASAALELAVAASEFDSSFTTPVGVGNLAESSASVELLAAAAKAAQA